MSYFDIVVASEKSTIVAEYIPEERKSTDYQSEAELEKDFIKRLVAQGYEYIKIKNENELIQNLRKQIEKLNNFSFTNSQWDRFYSSVLANNSEGIKEKTTKIQYDNVHVLTFEDGTIKNIMLIDNQDIHNNHLQVLNQYEESGGTYKAIYDVTILVNGLPLVHIELKRRGVPIKEAFNQINRYQRDNFWASSGLFNYVQIFIISNGTNTKYYSNTTRCQEGEKQKKSKNNFEYTFCWADGNNKAINDIVGFTKTFLAKHAILNILIKYCVFTTENVLLVMRPYQIVATERILNRIEVSSNNKKTGTVAAGGYIWHTTGSGKTLTSFKTARLASSLPYIDKVLFVVDRKDLDYQTMKEYDRFEKDSANSNTSTNILKRQLGDKSKKIIITTIQKLDRFINQNKTHTIYNEHVVIIFDECHRSQFGDMNKNITTHFNNYHIFGFTGTPILAEDSLTSNKYPKLNTTEQTFGDKLHTYTIVDAIRDNSVLPFRIDYINTIKNKEIIKDKKVMAIDTESALRHPDRICEITKYILEHFDQKTCRSQSKSMYEHKVITNVGEMAASKHNTVTENIEKRQHNGFNSIFAVASINMAKAYYNEFKKQTQETGRKLKFATIFSFNPNEEESDVSMIDEDFDTDKMDKTSRDFLETAMKDYNKMFSVSYDTSSDKFPNYYKDVSMRMKNRELDMLIVVNMFLTGFDAVTLNTLWVDKSLKQHGLIQSFSRTNRILNDVKTFGNIICFRNLQEETDRALALFGNKDAIGLALIRPYADYMNGYDENGEHILGYKELVAQLESSFPVAADIVGEKAQHDFVMLFGSILKRKNILNSFDEFIDDEISERDLQDYQSKYIDIHQTHSKKSDAEKENINDDIVFEIELIKQVEVNIDYILRLVAEYHSSNCQNQSILSAINKAINASIDLRSKRELIEQFITQLNANTDIYNDWRIFINEQKEQDINIIIKEENLKPEETKTFINNAFRDGGVKTIGTDLDKILPPVSRFEGTKRTDKKQNVIVKLLTFFEKYY